jgi:3-methylcrotonyl-CoA carboxylase alpha subunit
MMFQKILIANRGEIACRVITTARKLGIRTVAVYSDADAEAQHVQMADEAVRIGPAPVAESYLRGDAIIAAALATGAQAIHPGYGFLSENPDFVDAVTAAGLIFIGPSASAIRAMGLKDAAKALMVKAGVPVVPGYHGAEQGADFLAGQADKIGYPVLIKARAGGGGKGMRLVENPADFKAALEGAQREGRASFGDAAVLIERYITNPRHVEIQVFGDNHGNVVYLFERDCSLQRRHQKVIEEAPAPDMPPAVRAAMGRAAVDAAKAIGYSGAGTVEFITEGNLRADGFWFMEMNTRLQVEHPVSEAITGLDFVDLQLRVAAGEPLPFAQDDLHINGHAFEARLYAEDVSKGFLPATGRLDHLQFPPGVTFIRGPVRVDSGVRQGDAISPWYDPMIAKIIAHGATRADALAKLGQALAGCQVVGCVTNLDFLSALIRHPGFAAGVVDTGLIGRDLDLLVAESATSPAITALALLASLGLLGAKPASDPWQALANWRHWQPARQYAALDQNGARIEAYLTALSRDEWRVEIGEDVLVLGVTARDSGYSVRQNDHSISAQVVQTTGLIKVFAAGRSHAFTRPLGVEAGDQAQDSGGKITAPMPGLVKMVAVSVGQSVTKGQALLVLEAMKMEHTLTAPSNAVVAEVLAAPGDQVSDGSLLLRLETSDA